MTREFYTRLKQEFPKDDYILTRFNYEQFRVLMQQKCEYTPSFEEIESLAKKTLDSLLLRTFISETDILQGVAEKDIVIAPKQLYVGQSHFISFPDPKKILFSISWHAAYKIDDEQTEKYIEFAHKYFDFLKQHC